MEAITETVIALLTAIHLIWLAFLALIIFLDIVLFALFLKKKYVLPILIVEWLLISAPFIYYYLKFENGILIVAVVAFLLGQLLRKRKIEQLLERVEVGT